MTEINFLLPNGDVRVVDAVVGESLMRTALDNSIPGIEGQCGGELACATCHVYVGPHGVHVAPNPTPDEDEILDMVEARTRYSRLACQLEVTSELHGLEVEVGPN